MGLIDGQTGRHVRQGDGWRVVENPGMPDDTIALLNDDGEVVMAVKVPRTETTDDSGSDEVK